MNRTHKLALFAFALSTFAGCAKATKEDCEKAIPKIIKFELGLEGDLLKAMMQGEEKDKLIGECAGKVSKSEIDCVNNAADKAAYEKCK